MTLKSCLPTANKRKKKKKTVVNNEGADKIAKKSTRTNDIINIPIGKGETKAIIKKEIIKKWQDRWDKDKSGRKYYSLQTSINVHGGE